MKSSWQIKKHLKQHCNILDQSTMLGANQVYVYCKYNNLHRKPAIWYWGMTDNSLEKIYHKHITLLQYIRISSATLIHHSQYKNIEIYESQQLNSKLVEIKYLGFIEWSCLKNKYLPATYEYITHQLPPKNRLTKNVKKLQVYTWLQLFRCVFMAAFKSDTSVFFRWLFHEQ